MRAWFLVLAACGGAGAPARPVPPVDREAQFGPLEVGADYATYTNLTPSPFKSKAHGDRWVEVWVPAKVADAYVAGDDIPPGTVIVKTSWVDEGGAPSKVAGPIFVMKKGPPGSDPAREDWFYAIHWANPPEPWKTELGGPIYWRGKSPKVEYCWRQCHDNYDRGLGGLTPSSLVPR
jgi:hypothetical protein